MKESSRAESRGCETDRSRQSGLWILLLVCAAGLGSTGWLTRDHGMVVCGMVFAAAGLYLWISGAQNSNQ